MRVLITLLFLTVAAHAQEIVINNGIPRNAADARYVLRNPYYDGSQSVTVASATVTGANFSVGGGIFSVAGGKVNLGAVTSPSGALNIKGTALAPSQINIEADFATDVWKIGTDLGSRTLDFKYNTTDFQSITNAGAVSFHGSEFSVGGGIFSVSQGNVGIGTTAPDSKLHISSGEFKSDGNLSAMAGWTIGASRGVYARNATVGTISSGTVVTFSTLYNNAYGDIAITTNPANGSTPVGTVFTVAGCAAGALCQVCTEGLCPARLDSGSACANTNDAVITGTEVGRAKCTAAPDAATVHWRELGQPAIWTALNGDVIWVFAHRN